MTQPTTLPPAEVNLRDRFTYHPPTPEQPDVYRLIRDTGHLLALTVLYACPPSRNRELALEAVETAVMRANAAIAIHGLPDSAVTRTCDQLAETVRDALATAKPGTQVPIMVPDAARTNPPPLSADPWADGSGTGDQRPGIHRGEVTADGRVHKRVRTLVGDLLAAGYTEEQITRVFDVGMQEGTRG